MVGETIGGPWGSTIWDCVIRVYLNLATRTWVRLEHLGPVPNERLLPMGDTVVFVRVIQFLFNLGSVRLCLCHLEGGK